MSSPSIAVTAKPVVSNGPSLAVDSNANQISRRRTVAMAEKKSSIDVVSDGNLSGGHSFRGETIVHKPKELVQARKELMNSTISPRRRKAVTKEKPRWKRVISTLIKNLLLLLLLFALGQMIWKSVWKPEGPFGFQVGGLEGQISAIEKTVKDTTKLMQFQVDVLDKKIVDATVSLRKELEAKVEWNDNFIKKELKQLEGRTNDLDKLLAELKDRSFQSKEEFNNFLDELKGKGVQKGDLNLDEVRAIAREIVEKEIEKHAADGLGRVDYALASGGAKVIRHSEPFHFDKGSSWLPAVKSRTGVHYLSKKMLEPSFGQPGECFPLKGRNGFVEIWLRTAIVPEAVTLEHVAKAMFLSFFPVYFGFSLCYHMYVSSITCLCIATELL